MFQVSGENRGAETRLCRIEERILVLRFHWEIYLVGRQITYGTCNLTSVKAAESQAQQTIVGCVGCQLGRGLRRDLDGLATD